MLLFPIFLGMVIVWQINWLCKQVLLVPKIGYLRLQAAFNTLFIGILFIYLFMGLGIYSVFWIMHSFSSQEFSHWGFFSFEVLTRPHRTLGRFFMETFFFFNFLALSCPFLQDYFVWNTIVFFSFFSSIIFGLFKWRSIGGSTQLVSLYILRRVPSQLGRIPKAIHF